MRNLLLSLIALAIATPAMAGDLSVTIKDAAGQPVTDAVVTLHPAASDRGPSKFPWPYTMTQQDIAFHPFVLIVPVGATVSFPNKDKVRHHVYSFSPAKRFQLKLYGEDETRTIVFDKAGVVALGCNIHDRMMAFIDVVDTPWAAKSVAGKAVIVDAPAGAAVLTIWHPFLKGAAAPISKTIVLSARGGEETVTLDLRPPPTPGKMHM